MFSAGGLATHEPRTCRVLARLCCTGVQGYQWDAGGLTLNEGLKGVMLNTIGDEVLLGVVEGFALMPLGTMNAACMQMRVMMSAPVLSVLVRF